MHVLEVQNIVKRYSNDTLASLTDIEGTHLNRDLFVLSGFAVASLTVSAVTIRRRG